MDWHNENTHRSYPLQNRPGTKMTLAAGGVSSEVPLPDAVIVDFACIMGPAAGFATGEDTVYLQGILRDDNTLLFAFGTTATEQLLVFEVDSMADEFATCYAAVTIEGQDVPVWEGWLTLGRLDDLNAWLADTDYLENTAGEMVVEPATVQNMASHYVTGVTLVNAARQRVTPATDCGELPESAASYVAARMLTGDIRFVAGYNMRLNVLPGDGVVTFGAVVGAGMGEPIEEIPLFSSEVPPDGGRLLTGGPRCDELIATVNGVPGPVIPFMAGRGVDIGPHTLVVSITLRGLAICAEFESSAMPE